MPAFSAFAHEAITVSATAVGFTEGTFAPASTVPAERAIVTVEDASVYYRCDGTDPTSTTGHLLQAGDKEIIYGLQNIYNFRAIREAPVDATLRVTYEH